MKYSDIIDLPHFEPKTHPRMSMHNRAAQFAPFSALTGYDDAVTETARIVDHKIELSEEETEILDRKTRLAMESPDIDVLITYFVADNRKKGGAYVTKQGTLKNIDTIKRLIIMSDNMTIPLDDVIDIVRLHDAKHRAL